MVNDMIKINQYIYIWQPNIWVDIRREEIQKKLTHNTVYSNIYVSYNDW
jgi:hypothetical protein